MWLVLAVLLHISQGSCSMFRMILPHHLVAYLIYSPIPASRFYTIRPGTGRVRFCFWFFPTAVLPLWFFNHRLLASLILQPTPCCRFDSSTTASVWWSWAFPIGLLHSGCYTVAMSVFHWLFSFQFRCLAISRVTALQFKISSRVRNTFTRRAVVSHKITN